MKIVPVVWQPRKRTIPPSASSVPPPRFNSITIMLTEFCNLDCWMCDFAVSKGLTESLAWTPLEYISFLRHPFFKDLRAIGFTGGEPFAYQGVQELYAALQSAFPSMFISFSSNATLLKPMSETLALTRNWRQTRLFTSIDGVASHDIQRGKPGALDKSMKHLGEMRRRFPELGIDIKFTITPVNYQELKDAYLMCTELGFNFTAKMIENNPYYTNTLSFQEHQEDFRFNEEQLAVVREQLTWILDHLSPTVAEVRRAEMKEVLASLDPAWRRSGRCRVPKESAFLDPRKNFFACKEFPALINLNDATLDDIPASPHYRQLIEAEAKNMQACTRCTSQLKKPKVESRWTRLLGA